MNLNMKHRTTEALLNIIDLRAYFHPDVVKAASAEWQKRRKKRDIKKTLKNFGSL